jgi:hypothetical protein
MNSIGKYEHIPLRAKRSRRDEEAEFSESTGDQRSSDPLSAAASPRREFLPGLEEDEEDIVCEVLVVSPLGYSWNETFRSYIQGGITGWGNQLSLLLSSGCVRKIDRMSQYRYHNSNDSGADGGGIVYRIFFQSTPCRENDSELMDNYWISALIRTPVKGLAVIMRQDKQSVTKREIFQLFQSLIPCNEYRNE